MPSERDLVEDLVFECLERAGRDQAAVDELLAPHEGPVAQQVRATLATLQQVGLAGQVGEPTRADRFGPYQLLDRVGSGAMGVVYRARRADASGSTAPLALKVMQPGLLPVRGNRVRFEREIRALRELDHPGICPILDDGEVDGVPFLVMPFIDGPSLRELFETGARDATARERLLAALEHVAQALHHAHERGFVHRDVKPGNIVVRPEGRAVLLDFGLARVEQAAANSALTATGGVVGTPAYMAPEQVAGRTDVDRRCDVYALGVVLYEGLTGRLPHEAPTRESLYRQILTGEIAPPSRRVRGLPTGADAVCAMALARDPVRRYRTAGLLAEDLARLRRGEAPLARLPGRLERAVGWMRRHPLPSALLALLSLALIGIAVMAADARLAARVGRAELRAIAAQRDAYSEPMRALADAYEDYELAPAEALVAMQTALAAEQPYCVTPAFASPPAGVWFSADARWLFARDEIGAGRLFVLPAAPGNRTCAVDAEFHDVASAAFLRTPRGAALLVIGHRDGRLVATRPGERGHAWTLAGPVAADPVAALHPAPAKDRFLSIAARTARVVRSDGTVVASVEAQGSIGPATWLDDERFALAASDATGGGLAAVWRVRSEQPELLGHRSWSQPIALLRACPAAEHLDVVLVVPSGQEGYLWDSTTDLCTPLRPRKAFEREILAADWATDGACVFLADESGRTQVFSASGKPVAQNAYPDDIACGRSLPNSTHLALLGDQGSVTFVSFEGQMVRARARNRVRKHMLEFSRDGSLMANATWGNEIAIRQLFDVDLPEFWGGGSVVGVAWDGDHAIVTAHDMSAPPGRGALRSWNTGTGRATAAPLLLPERVYGFDLDASHGRALVVTRDDNHTRVRLFRREDGQWLDAGTPPDGILRGHCLGSLLTGTGLALLADSKGGVALWNTTTGAWSRLPAADAPRAANMPDGRWFAVAATPDASTIWAGGLAGYVHRLDRREDGAYDEAPPVRIGEFVSCLLALPDGSIMVGGVNGHLVRVLPDGTRREFARRGGRIMSIAATSLDGETIVATGDFTGALGIWHADGRLMRRIEFDHGVVNSLAFSSDGERLLCGAGGSARIWPVRHQRVVELARERLR